MSAIDEVFTKLRAANKKAFMPFVTAGDPDLEFTAAAITELAARGANLIEIGFPYSDPIADGPVIQASYTRVLNKKTTVDQILAMTGKVAKEVACPLVGMVSYAIIFRRGLAEFVEAAKTGGLSGLIVPDLLVEESAELAKICRSAGMSLIFLVTPTTPRERILKIAEASTGFLYFVSITGITGERTQLPPDLVEQVRWLRSQTKLPVCIGFGISGPEHVKLLGPVADGLIVGSAVVRRIAEAATKPKADVLKDVGEYAAGLLNAME